MLRNGILGNTERIMDQSATIAGLSIYFTALYNWLASSVSNEKFANASDISAGLQQTCTILQLLVILQKAVISVAYPKLVGLVVHDEIWS